MSEPIWIAGPALEVTFMLTQPQVGDEIVLTLEPRNPSIPREYEGAVGVITEVHIDAGRIPECDYFRAAFAEPVGRWRANEDWAFSRQNIKAWRRPCPKSG